MQAASQDSVLIEQVVMLASKARTATGQEPIYDMPKGTTSGQNCPIARALNLDCSVRSSAITFSTDEHAQLIGKALGLNYAGRVLSIPDGHPFRQFVSRFDGGKPKMRFFRL